MTELVKYHVEDGVALITLNRPQSRNAMSVPMFAEFQHAMARAGTDPNVRVIVLTGEGKGFCAGADMGDLKNIVESGETAVEDPPPGSPNPILDVLTDSPAELRNIFLAPAAVPQPVIAAINGAAAGIGFVIAVSCDIRFMSSEAIVTAGFPMRGLIAEIGVAWSLQHIIGHGAASDILLSGRKVSAAEAQRMGFANEVLAPEALLPHAMAYAREIALNVSPRSTRIIKRQLREAWTQTHLEALQLAYHEVRESFKSEDFAEGIQSFLERRAPRFTGR